MTLPDQRGRPAYNLLLALLNDRKIDTTFLDAVVGETQRDMREAGWIYIQKIVEAKEEASND